MIDHSKYPDNWLSEIRPRILKRANNCCEICGIKNHATGYRDKQGIFHISEGLQMETDELDGEKIIQIVLTVAHLDHDITHNTDDNLKALCQKCHLNYDAEHHKQTRKYGRNENQLTLF